MYRDDYLLRIVRQLAEAGARALGLRAKNPDEALETIEAAKRALPLVPGAHDSLSAATVLELLGGIETALGLAQLYRAEAEVRAQLGDPEAASRSARRALQFFVEAARGGPISESETALFRELALLHLSRARLPAGSIAALGLPG